MWAPKLCSPCSGPHGYRGIQTLVIAQQTENWLNEYENNIAKDKQIVEDYAVPANAKGVGFLDAPRGGLSHWGCVGTARSAVQLVVPTTWNPDRGATRACSALPKKLLSARP